MRPRVPLYLSTLSACLLPLSPPQFGTLGCGARWSCGILNERRSASKGGAPPEVWCSRVKKPLASPAHVRGLQQAWFKGNVLLCIPHAALGSAGLAGQAPSCSITFTFRCLAVHFFGTFRQPGLVLCRDVIDLRRGMAYAGQCGGGGLGPLADPSTCVW